MSAEANVIIWGDGGGSTFRATIDALHRGEVDGFSVTGVITTNRAAGILDHVNYANRSCGMDIEPLVVDGQPGRRQDEATQNSILQFMHRRNASSIVLMGAMVIIGETIVRQLNGEIPEIDFPKTLQGSREIMRNLKDGTFDLPADFPSNYIDENPGRFGLTNTHPAPTIVTANTHGRGAQERLLRLGSLTGGPTYHAVAPGIDNGPVLAFEPVSIGEYLRPEYMQTDFTPTTEFESDAQSVFDAVQKVEKQMLPRWVARQIQYRAEFLKKQS